MPTDAAYYTGNRSFSLEQIEQAAPGPGEVQIDVAFCGICGTDLHVYLGHMDARIGDHRVIGHERAGHSHEFGNVPEASHVHPHGGNARRLDRSLDVPDRHVAHGSNGDQQHRVDAVVAQPLRPGRSDLALDATLRRRPDERERRGRQFADHAAVVEGS